MDKVCFDYLIEHLASMVDHCFADQGFVVDKVCFDYLIEDLACMVDHCFAG